MTQELSTQIAKNLVLIRKTRQITQDRLAKLAELPKSTISNLESGSANPTLDTIYRISKALSISIEELISIPAVEITKVTSEKMPYIKGNSKSKTKVKRLIPDPFTGIDFYSIEMDPGETLKGAIHGKLQKLYFYVTDGQMTVHVHGESYVLKRGDALVFPEDEAHSFVNSYTQKSSALLIVSYSTLQ